MTTASAPASEYAVVAKIGDTLEVLATCATAADAVAQQKVYPGSVLAYRNGGRWALL